MGETDRARREIEAARQELTGYADELFRRASPQHLKDEARARIQAKSSLVQARIKSQAFAVRDRVQHDRNTQLTLGSIGALGLLALGRRRMKARSARRELRSEQELARVSSLYRTDARRQGSPRQRDLLGPPPPVYGPAVTSYPNPADYAGASDYPSRPAEFSWRPGGVAFTSRRTDRSRGQRLGLGTVLLGGASLLGMRALSRRPELKERLTQGARELSSTASQRVKQVSADASSKVRARLGRSNGPLEVQQPPILSG